MREPNRFHVALNVRDLERSILFYRQVLGLAPDKVHPGYARFLLDDPSLILSLNASAKVSTGNRVAHLGIRLGGSDALAHARARVVGAGHRVRDQQRTLCCHALQDKFWVDDPDGNEWEFYVVTDDDPESASVPGSRADSAGHAPEACCE